MGNNRHRWSKGSKNTTLTGGYLAYTYKGVNTEMKVCEDGREPPIQQLGGQCGNTAAIATEIAPMPPL